MIFYIILAIASATLVMGLIVRALFLIREERRSRGILAALRSNVAIASRATTVAVARQPARIVSLFYRGGYKAFITKQLAVLATIETDAEAKFIKQKQFSTIAAIVFFPLLLSSSNLMALFSLIIFFAPDLLIYNRVQKHQVEVKNALPQTIDLLSLCVDAGLTFTSALGRVAQMQGGPMGEELSRLLREVRLGVTPAQAFLALAQRTGQVELYRFVNALNQVEKLGAPISLVLREQGGEFREVRRARAREAAQKVPVKILGPIMLCFLPALIVIVVAPAIIGIMKTLSTL